MQDSLTSSFRCGETFDTAPYGGSPHPDERFTRRAVDRTCETRKKLRFLLACELKKQRVTRYGEHVSLLHVTGAQIITCFGS